MVASLASSLLNKPAWLSWPAGCPQVGLRCSCGACRVYLAAQGSLLEAGTRWLQALWWAAWSPGASFSPRHPSGGLAWGPRPLGEP